MSIFCFGLHCWAVSITLISNKIPINMSALYPKIDGSFWVCERFPLVDQLRQTTKQLFYGLSWINNLIFGFSMVLTRKFWKYCSHKTWDMACCGTLCKSILTSLWKPHPQNRHPLQLGQPFQVLLSELTISFLAFSRCFQGCSESTAPIKYDIWHVVGRFVTDPDFPVKATHKTDPVQLGQIFQVLLFSHS